MSAIIDKLLKGAVCSSLEQTAVLASEFAKVLPEDCTIALSGDLGTGKTAFVKALAKALGITQTVKSPSFNICCVYDIPKGRKLVHIDAYRFTDGSQYESLLVDEIAPSPHIVCIEWAEIVEEYIEPDFWLKFDIQEQAHTIKLLFSK